MLNTDSTNTTSAVSPAPDMLTVERKKDSQGHLIYRVPETNLGSLLSRIATLNRRAIRLGMTPIAVAEIGEEFAYRHHDGAVYAVRFVLLTVTGETPRIAGWAFAATLQHEDTGNIMRTCPGFEMLIPARYRQAERHCDHCQTERRRTNTYILFGEHCNPGEEAVKGQVVSVP
jgi:hypothetical protein